MTATRTIPLVNPGLISDEYWLVHYAPNPNEWDVREIEIYWDRDHKRLKSDDNKFESLSADAQISLICMLNDWLADQQKLLHGFHRLMADLRADATRANLRLVSGGVT